MTKEKAIDLLDNLIGMTEDNQGNDYDLALKMGIKVDLTKKLYTINERSAIIAIKNGQPFSETYKAGIKEEDEKGARLEM